jgi:hypothetical protein
MSTAEPRTRAREALRDPRTPAAALAAIARAHPEFADEIGRHPHAYPQLVTWSHAVLARDVQAPPVPEAPATDAR